MDGYLGNYKQKFQDFKNYITEVFKMTNECRATITLGAAVDGAITEVLFDSVSDVSIFI